MTGTKFYSMIQDPKLKRKKSQRTRVLRFGKLRALLSFIDILLSDAGRKHYSSWKFQLGTNSCHPQSNRA